MESTLSILDVVAASEKPMSAALPSRPPMDGSPPNAKQISLQRAHTRNLQRWKSSTEDIIEEAQQALRDHRQPWWYPEQGVFEAADTFDKELQQRCNTAHSTFHELKRGGESQRSLRAYHQQLRSLRFLRYTVQPLRLGTPRDPRLAPTSDMTLASKSGGPWLVVNEQDVEARDDVDDKDRDRRPARRLRWRIQKSIWAPRQTKSNSKDFYETDAAMERTFATDWTIAREAHNLAQFIQRFQAKAEGLSDGSDILAALADEIDQVKKELWKDHNLIWGAFEYYSALYENEPDDHGEFNIFSMTLNAFLTLTRDAGYINCFVPVRYLELVFETVDVDGDAVRERVVKSGATIDTRNARRRLNRHEFFEAIVHIAVVRYMITTTPFGTKAKDKQPKVAMIKDVSEAVRKCLHDIRGNLPNVVRQDSNRFRSRFCYIEETDQMLMKHKETLQNIYAQYASENHTLDELHSRKLMSVGELYQLVADLGLVATGNITLHEVKLIFLWSRIRSVPDYSARAQRFLRNLFFEDFLEAIVRLSLMTALPTDAELIETNAEDAGEYIMKLRNYKDEMRTFIRERKRSWDQEPLQRVGRCVDHFCCFMARMMEINSTGGVNYKVSQKEVMSFRRRSKAHLSVFKTAADENTTGSFFRHARDRVSARLFEILSLVPLFGGLTTQQLETLSDRMTDAPFDKGDVIIQQGDPGDSFYVIFEGKAEAFRQEDGSEVVLKTYDTEESGKGEYFGERALLKKEPRYASIVALTHVHTFMISQREFEQALGYPLSALLPEYDV